MTRNQIDYQNNRANQRLQAQKNRIAEWTLEEQQRANAETARANRAREHNQAIANSLQSRGISETERSNQARENLTQYANLETARHQKAQESINTASNLLQSRAIAETERTNRRNESLRQESNDIDRYGKALSAGTSLFQSLLRLGGSVYGKRI